MLLKSWKSSRMLSIGLGKIKQVQQFSSPSPPNDVLQNSSSQNMFSFSYQKAPAFSGIFDDKKSIPAFQFGANNGFSTPNMPSIFSASGSQSFSMQTPTLFSVNQQPVLSGNQNTAEASGDAAEDAEPEQPSSPSVKKAEEKGIVVHEAKCKVYVKHDDATKGWKDIGVGQLSIRCKEGAEKASKESTPAIVIRNDDAQSSESGSATVVARTYLFRLKNEEASKLSATIKENAPLD